jgi:glycosyltransferase involved in cell wall biosynthesis
VTASGDPRSYVFDARVIQDHFPGIGRVALNLLRALPAQLRADERLIVLHDPSAKNTRLPFNPHDPAWPASIQFAEHRTPVFSLRNLSAPLPAHGAITHHQYYVRPLRDSGASITSIYDAISFVYPRYVPSARARLQIRLLHALAVARSDAVLTISQSAAADLTRAFPALKHKLTVVPLAADAIYHPRDQSQQRAARARFGIDGPFAFYIASNKPHKNLNALIDAWARLKPAHATLVLAGHQDPRYPQAQHRAAALGLGAVKFIGAIDDDSAAALHSACDVFVFPSLYEGFGLTPLEAMACGTPVACSNASSLPEVTGDAALQFDPHNPQAIADALEQLFDSAQLRAAMREKSLIQAARFSWERTAADTIAVYRGLRESR